MVRTLFALVLAVAVMPAVSSAKSTKAVKQTASADLSGTWSGTIAIPEEGKREKSPLFATFKQVGSNLTGSVGPRADAQVSISKGQVESTKFGTSTTFELVGPSFVMRFDLKLGDGMLRGLARLDSEKATAPVELKMSK